MPEGIQDYLTNWFAKHGDHKHFSSAEEWINFLSNWDLLMWIDIYNEDMRNRTEEALPTSETGFVFLGPDGSWHWSDTYQTHENITDQRPATAVEAGIANMFRHPLAELNEILKPRL